MKQLRLLVLLVLFSHCEEPIDLKFKNEPKDYLVIEGIITSQPKAHQITISRATPFTNNEVTPFKKESVNDIRITDDLGNIYPLFEVDQGVYVTESNFAALTGRSYQLKLTTANNKSYESKPQTILPVGSIGDAKFEYDVEQIFNSEAEQFVDKGVLKVFADYDLPQNGNFAAVDWEGTFILKTELGTPKDCYVADKNNGIAPIITNNGLTNNSFTNQELFTITYDFRFRYRYSLNILMYSIDETAAKFLSEVEQQLNSTGSIFDPAPRQISGNISNTRDENEVVLGFFGAFNVTEKRILISRNNIPAGETFNICDRGGPGNPPDFCFDCTLFFGSTDVQPPYWEN